MQEPHITTCFLILTILPLGNPQCWHTTLHISNPQCWHTLPHISVTHSADTLPHISVTHSADTHYLTCPFHPLMLHIPSLMLLPPTRRSSIKSPTYGPYFDILPSPPVQYQQSPRAHSATAAHAVHTGRSERHSGSLPSLGRDFQSNVLLLLFITFMCGI
jgi:hypothetical protein